MNTKKETPKKEHSIKKGNDKLNQRIIGSVLCILIGILFGAYCYIKLNNVTACVIVVLTFVLVGAICFFYPKLNNKKNAPNKADGEIGDFFSRFSEKLMSGNKVETAFKESASSLKGSYIKDALMKCMDDKGEFISNVSINTVLSKQEEEGVDIVNRGIAAKKLSGEDISFLYSFSKRTKAKNTSFDYKLIENVSILLMVVLFGLILYLGIIGI